jgi:hypothetical protein
VGRADAVESVDAQAAPETATVGAMPVIAVTLGGTAVAVAPGGRDADFPAEGQGLELMARGVAAGLTVLRGVDLGEADADALAGGGLDGEGVAVGDGDDAAGEVGGGGRRGAQQEEGGKGRDEGCSDSARHGLRPPLPAEWAAQRVGGFRLADDFGVGGRTAVRRPAPSTILAPLDG